MGIEDYAVLNDIHFPYENKAAYRKALSRMENLPNLKGIFLNGDIGEVESVSSYPKAPGSNRHLMTEIAYINEKFDHIQRTFKDIPVTLICGNHCYRIFRYIRDVAPEMWGMLECPKLFKFEDRPKWKFVDYGPTQWVRCAKSQLYLRHEPLAGGTVHAKGTAEQSYVSVLYGHTHTYQQFTHKKNGPIPYTVTATSGGWLGDIKQACFDYRGAKDNWVNGMTEIKVDSRTQEHDLHFMRL